MTWYWLWFYHKIRGCGLFWVLAKISVYCGTFEDVFGALRLGEHHEGREILVFIDCYLETGDHGCFFVVFELVGGSDLESILGGYIRSYFKITINLTEEHHLKNPPNLHIRCLNLTNPHKIILLFRTSLLILVFRLDRHCRLFKRIIIRWLSRNKQTFTLGYGGIDG